MVGSLLLRAQSTTALRAFFAAVLEILPYREREFPASSRGKMYFRNAPLLAMYIHRILYPHRSKIFVPVAFTRNNSGCAAFLYFVVFQRHIVGGIEKYRGSRLDKNKDLVFETLRRQKSSHEPPFAILSSVIRLYMEMYLVSVHFASGINKTQISKSLGIHEFKVGKYINSISGVNPKKLERAVELCREADVKSKSYSNMVSYIPVERLISALATLFCR